MSGPSSPQGSPTQRTRRRRWMIMLWLKIRVLKARRYVNSLLDASVASVVGRSIAINQMGQDDQSKYQHPVWTAIREGKVDDAQTCVMNDPACVELRGDVGETPLHWCFLYYGKSQRQIAIWILEQTPELAEDVYEMDLYYGENVLHMAIIHRDMEMVRWLVELAPQLMQGQAMGSFFQPGGTCYYGEQPLFFAACTGQQELVSLLLTLGADLVARDSHGNSVFHMLVWHGLVEMYEFVLSLWPLHGEDPARLLNKERLTPLTLAAKLGQQRMLEYLLSRRECPMEWQLGDLAVNLYPLEELDYIEGPARPTVLDLLVQEGHAEMLAMPCINAVLTCKWEASLKRIFYTRLLTAALYALLFTMTIVMDDSDRWIPFLLARLSGLVVAGVAARKWWLALLLLARNGPVAFFKAKGAVFLGNITTLSFGACMAALVGMRLMGHGDLLDPFLLALAGGCVWLHLLSFLLAFRFTGPCIVMLSEIILGDLVPFLTIFSIFSLGFSSAFAALCGPAGPEGFFHRIELSILMMVGQYNAFSGKCERGPRGVMAVLLMVVNALLVSVLMVNMLIAMMGSTFERVSSTADFRWRLEWARIMKLLQQEHEGTVAHHYWIEVKGQRYIRTVERLVLTGTSWQLSSQPTLPRLVPPAAPGRLPVGADTPFLLPGDDYAARCPSTRSSSWTGSVLPTGNSFLLRSTSEMLADPQTSFCPIIPGITNLRKVSLQKRPPPNKRNRISPQVSARVDRVVPPSTSGLLGEYVLGMPNMGLMRPPAHRSSSKGLLGEAEAIRGDRTPQRQPDRPLERQPDSPVLQRESAWTFSTSPSSHKPRTTSKDGFNFADLQSRLQATSSPAPQEEPFTRPHSLSFSGNAHFLTLPDSGRYAAPPPSEGNTPPSAAQRRASTAAPPTTTATTTTTTISLLTPDGAETFFDCMDAGPIDAHDATLHLYPKFSGVAARRRAGRAKARDEDEDEGDDSDSDPQAGSEEASNVGGEEPSAPEPNPRFTLSVETLALPRIEIIGVTPRHNTRLSRTPPIHLADEPPSTPNPAPAPTPAGPGPADAALAREASDFSLAGLSDDSAADRRLWRRVSGSAAGPRLPRRASLRNITAVAPPPLLTFPQPMPVGCSPPRCREWDAWASDSPAVVRYDSPPLDRPPAPAPAPVPVPLPSRAAAGPRRGSTPEAGPSREVQRLRRRSAPHLLQPPPRAAPFAALPAVAPRGAALATLRGRARSCPTAASPDAPLCYAPPCRASPRYATPTGRPDSPSIAWDPCSSSRGRQARCAACVASKALGSPPLQRPHPVAAPKDSHTPQNTHRTLRFTTLD